MADATLKQEPDTAGKLWGGGRSPFNVSWGKMYMWFFLVSDAFTFSSLLIAYGTMRHRFAEIWPKAGEVFTHFPYYEGHLPLMYVGLMTFILILSSVTMVLAVDAGHRRNNLADTTRRPTPPRAASTIAARCRDSESPPAAGRASHTTG